MKKWFDPRFIREIVRLRDDNFLDPDYELTDEEIRLIEEEES